MRWLKFTAVVALLILAIGVAPGVTRAEGPDRNGQLLPELGPVVPGLTPGVGGYKVFGPDAIQRVPVRPLGPSRMSPSMLNIYRAGWSDAYRNDCGQYYYCLGGSHISQSDLVEEQIWVDGSIKTNLDGTWRAFCSKHSEGQSAPCSSSWDPGGIWSSGTAHSWHHFHKTGYVDDDFQTEDNSV